MLIDWFTVGAQTLNFLVLVGLMKRFLYHPILHVIDEREKRIAAELAEADAKKQQAQRQYEEFQQKNQALDQQKAALMAQAHQEASTERLRLLAEAQKAADILTDKRNEAWRNQAKHLAESVNQKIRQEIFAVARQALSDLANTELEAQMVSMFCQRLRTMDGQSKAVLAEAICTASEPASLRSAFALTAEQQAALQQAVDGTFPNAPQMRFAIAADLVAGIELTVNGQKLAWSINGYLGGLENMLANFSETKTETPDS